MLRVLSFLGSLAIAWSLFGQSLIFIENKGQWSDEILYAADLAGGKISIEAKAISILLPNPKLTKPLFDHTSHGNQQALSVDESRHGEVRIAFDGARNPVIRGLSDKGTLYNFYLGDHSSSWATACHGFEEVILENLYQNIDLKIYSTAEGLKYDFMVRVGGNPADISLKYSGVKDLKLQQGRLIASAPFSDMIEKKPIAFQEDQRIPVRFSLANGTVGYEVDSYDRSRELIIDPELIFSTFSGSVSDNFGFTACYDDAGNFYSGGIVFGNNFPTTNATPFGGGTTDVLILKYDSSGQHLLYATFIGGTSEEAPHSMIVNSANELLIFGTSGSANFPATSGAYDETFNGGDSFSIFGNYDDGVDLTVTKLDNKGALKESTYVGSTGNDGMLMPVNFSSMNPNRNFQNYGDHYRGEIFVDELDNVLIATTTNGTDFPTTSSIQPEYGGGLGDAVVLSLSSDLSAINWSTYWGRDGEESGFSVKSLPNGRIVLGGGVTSDNLPTTADALMRERLGVLAGYVTIFDTQQDQILASTYLGTNGQDQVFFVEFDADENIYALGQTTGTYPILGPVYNNANGGIFIHKMNNQLSETLFSTSIGSGSSDPDISPTAFLVNECNYIFLSGWGGVVNSSNSRNNGDTFGLPVTEDADYPTTDGSDFYLMVLDENASQLLYATFFGSTNSSGDHVDGGSSRFDKRGIVYQSVCSCGGTNDNFPTTPNAYSTTNNGVNTNNVPRCNNASFKYDLNNLIATMEVNGERNPDSFEFCAPLSLSFKNVSAGDAQANWYFGDGNGDVGDSTGYNYQTPGTYLAQLIITDESTCSVADTASVVINVRALPNITLNLEEITICNNEEIQLEASGGTTYLWTPPNGLTNPRIANPVASPDETTNYQVRVTNQYGCVSHKSVLVNVEPQIIYDFEVIRKDICNEQSLYVFKSHLNLPDEILWQFGDGQTSDELNPVHTYGEHDEYDVTLTTGSDYPCTTPVTQTIQNDEVFVPNVFTPNGDDINDRFVIRSAERPSLVVVNREGREVFRADHYENNWDASNVDEGTYFYAISFPSNKELCNGWVKVIK